MTAPSAVPGDSLRKGWCPGALRPMQTGDGLLVRLRLTGGIVSAALTRALAAAARRHGNGLFDLSARSNLQMRGVGEATLDPLIGTLRGLGVLDEDPDGEAVRNVIGSPLAGHDTTAVCDTRPVVAALERRLAGDASLHGLPGKFGMLVDGGGALPLGDIACDLRFVAVAGPDGPRFAVAAGGDAATAVPVGLCAPDAVPEVAARLASAFLRLRGAGPGLHRRMATLVRAVGGEALAQAAALPFAPRPAQTAPGRTGLLGVRGDPRTGRWLGVGAAFGRWTADDLDALARVAERDGAGELRLTPWRAILLPGVGAGDGARALAAADRFVVDDADPRLAVIACSGAPDCSSALAPTRPLALSLAGAARDLAAAGIAVHVSGCAKGCAWPQAAPVTVVARSADRPSYDLVLEGKAGDAAVRTGLSPAEMAVVLGDLAAKTAHGKDDRTP